MTAYYNEFDPFAAQWLRNLIDAGYIPEGDVDERSILDVSPGDLIGYTQCHFFAGIAGWPLALRMAGWPDDRPVWTGSPPCQPFSVAGQQKGKDDDRHLAPHFARLIAARRPAVVIGEQVASAAVLGRAAKPRKRDAGGDGDAEWCWLDDLFGTLEAARYACAAADIPAAGVGAPHIRQRCWWAAIRVGVPDGAGWLEGGQGSEAARYGGAAGPDGRSVGLADGVEPGLEGHGRDGDNRDKPGRVYQDEAGPAADRGRAGRLADAERGAAERHGHQMGGAPGQDQGAAEKRQWVWNDAGDGVNTGWPSPAHGGWGDVDWLGCRDGKWRPVMPSFIGVADGVPSCLGALCPGEKAEEVGDAENPETGPREDLQALREKNASEAARGAPAGHGGVPPGGVLRPEVHGTGDAEDQVSVGIPQSGESGEVCQTALRDLRRIGEAARPPQRRGSYQQHPVELDDIVPVLPQESALAELHGRWRDRAALHLLSSAICEVANVPHSPEQASAAWASLGEEAKDRVSLAAGGAFLRVTVSPLTPGPTPGRVGRPRAYGNAIVPQAGAVWISTVMEAMNDV